MPELAVDAREPPKRPIADDTPQEGRRQKRSRVRQDPAKPEMTRPFKKSISFREVYNSGSPTHYITPTYCDKRRWFIFECDQHNIKFNAAPGILACQHSHNYHGYPYRSMATTELIAMFGIAVIGCDEAGAKMNNDAWKRTHEPE